MSVIYSGSVKATSVTREVEVFEEKKVLFREEMIRNVEFR